jgi:hypothetical protein
MVRESRQLPREHQTSHKVCTMCLFSFKRMEKCDVIAEIVDMTPAGVGIKVIHKVEPGFVWFSEKIEGHRGGLLMWSKELDSLYRGGIKFVPLSDQDEQMIGEKLSKEGPLKDTTIIAETIIASLKNNGGGYIIQTES